ncbi:recombinase family protein [Lysinibacillus sp. NPDC093692]|uniref:recombinase family protein n=1 Tax=Lysinibacillus sp. NPDC093692 TaxID=3390578 RepID=UPI003CFF8FF5
MKEKNLIIVYSRVSSAAQNLELQEAAANRYLESMGYSGEENFIIRLDDHDVSATKLKMAQRPSLMQLIRLIKEGKVKTIVAYKRDRLARNFYEFVDITKIFIEYDVEVIYTASNEPPFKKKLALEAFYGMFAQMEGQNISIRTADARKQYPSNIFGYKRITYETSKPRYIVNEDQKCLIESLVTDFSKVTNEEQFLDYLMIKRKGLKDPDKIIKILTNPFYSGHYESKSHYQVLLRKPKGNVVITFLQKLLSLNRLISSGLEHNHSVSQPSWNSSMVKKPNP